MRDPASWPPLAAGANSRNLYRNPPPHGIYVTYIADTLTISLPGAAPKANASSALREVARSGGNSVASMCTESGIWEHVGLDCVFDPLAISLEDGSAAGSLLDGWKSLGGGGDGVINASMIATIAVLATLVVLAGILVVVFFTHKK